MKTLFEVSLLHEAVLFFNEASMKHLYEASYEGNIGISEISKFMNLATDEEKKQLHQHIAMKRNSHAWDLIERVTKTKLHRASL